nr:MAG TPA: hypothetical protein [Caudoviricetes sp.]
MPFGCFMAEHSFSLWYRHRSMEGRRVSSGKAEKEAEVRFLGLPGGNLQKYIDNYMLLH